MVVVGEEGASRTASHTKHKEPKGNNDPSIRSHLAGLRGRHAGDEMPEPDPAEEGRGGKLPDLKAHAKDGSKGGKNQKKLQSGGSPGSGERSPEIVMKPIMVEKR